MQVYTSFSGCRNYSLSMGDGILTHLPIRSPDPTEEGEKREGTIDSSCIIFDIRKMKNK
jgi:hypothetical protein